MPVKTIKYLCKFKCGKKSVTYKGVMAEHEEKFCFRNPENKTCQTCINSTYEHDYDETGAHWTIRGCKFSSMDKLLEEIHDDLVIPSNKNHVRPLWHCPNHNQNEEQISTVVYVAEQLDKIKKQREEKEFLATFPF